MLYSFCQLTNSQLAAVIIEHDDIAVGVLWPCATLWCWTFAGFELTQLLTERPGTLRTVANDRVIKTSTRANSRTMGGRRPGRRDSGIIKIVHCLKDAKEDTERAGKTKLRQTLQRSDHRLDAFYSVSCCRSPTIDLWTDEQLGRVGFCLGWRWIENAWSRKGSGGCGHNNHTSNNGLFEIEVCLVTRACCVSNHFESSLGNANERAKENEVEIAVESYQPVFNKPSATLIA